MKKINNQYKKYNAVYKVWYNVHTTDGRNIDCNGNRKRTKESLHKIVRFIDNRLRNLYMQLDICRHEGSEHGQTSDIKDVVQMLQIVNKIAYYKHVQSRSAIYYEAELVDEMMKNAII